MSGRVCILDYGSGNVRSVFNLLASIGGDVRISNDPGEIESASHLILPGVGAFGASMAKVRDRVPIDAVKREVFDRRKPFLGICVGMQLLADRGLEFGDHAGLGWIPGVVDRLASAPNPLPHIGWNNIDIVRSSPLLDSFQTHQDFYFVHSYVFRPVDPAAVVARTDYGETFAAMIARENIFGVQFHPEKSQKAGRVLMQNFLKQ
jgi:imidazole glycerol-phosphate synthase subunit HisH